MTIDQIEMLEAIVLEGSMQKAAKKLHKSQPSLSVGIKKLEEYYNIKIFSRESYRPTLTKKGKIFYRNALPLLRSHRQLHKVASELGSGVESEIRIVIDALADLSKLCEFFQAATPFAKSTQILMSEDVYDGPIQAIADKKAQFAIGHCPPHREYEVLKKRVGRVELIPVVKKGVDPEVVPNIFVTNQIEQKNSEHHKQSTWFVTSHSRKEELIMAGLGWGRVSKERYKERKSELTKVNLREGLSLDVYLMIHKENPLSRVGQAMWQAAKQL